MTWAPILLWLQGRKWNYEVLITRLKSLNKNIYKFDLQDQNLWKNFSKWNHLVPGCWDFAIPHSWLSWPPIPVLVVYDGVKLSKSAPSESLNFQSRTAHWTKATSAESFELLDAIMRIMIIFRYRLQEGEDGLHEQAFTFNLAAVMMSYERRGVFIMNIRIRWISTLNRPHKWQ